MVVLTFKRSPIRKRLLSIHSLYACISDTFFYDFLNRYKQVSVVMQYVQFLRPPPKIPEPSHACERKSGSNKAMNDSQEKANVKPWPALSLARCLGIDPQWANKQVQ